MIKQTFYDQIKQKVKSEKDKEFLEKSVNGEDDNEEDFNLSTEKKKKQSKPHRILSVK